ncbi:MAG: hypothetical protein QOE28_2481 [Solirubrobacteraceae bacterium]|nr:hypothetical protein [Solirubrobacteraceae bacterium]
MSRAVAPPSGRLGGIEGNETLTSAVAVVLVVLLAAEGVTILMMRPLLREHMFIGLVLVPPVLMKLASTGYRFARYYTGSRAYREKGPPALPLRLLAPVLVAATLGVFATGVALLLIGHRSRTVLELHKITFIVWGVFFVVHFLWHLPRAWRAASFHWRASRPDRRPGSTLRALAVTATIGGGFALALVLLAQIDAWQRGH